MLTQISKAIAIATEPNYLFILALAISATLYFRSYNLQPTTYNLAHKRYAILLATTTIATAATIKIIKEIVRAPRPITSLIQETGYSFPSGHTTFAIVFFSLLVYIFTKTQKTRIVATTASILIILTIALSRLQLQVHHPIDILGGLIIGTSILTLSILVHKKITS